MGCSKCVKRRNLTEEEYDVMGGYAYLPDRQIRARLNIFKKRFCKKCDKRYICNYVMYKKCKSK